MPIIGFINKIIIIKNINIKFQVLIIFRVNCFQNENRIDYKAFWYLIRNLCEQ